MTATREKRMAGSFYYASLWRSRNGMVEPENDIPNPLYPQDPCPIPFPAVFSARSLEDPGDSKRRPDLCLFPLPSPSGPVAPTLHQVRERCSSSRRIPIRPLREILRVPSGWNTCGRKVQCPRRTPSLRARALQQKASNSIMTSCRKCRDLMERLQRFRRRLQRAAGWVLSPAPTWKPYEP